jgi:curved DNA-binding protein CbpA
MKLDSKYFDSIRLAPKAEPVRETVAPACQWKGCSGAGAHRAPKGRGRDGEYFFFCLDHVREFNASYNYFDGMSNAEVEEYQKDATTGHRPTWKLRDTAGPTEGERPRLGRYARFARAFAADPHDLLDRDSEAGAPGPGTRRRPLRALERRALDTLHLAEAASRADIKTRFKELVKRHHPDANGGDRGSEDKLREIIQAYNYLKQAGLV